MRIEASAAVNGALLKGVAGRSELMRAASELGCRRCWPRLDRRTTRCWSPRATCRSTAESPRSRTSTPNCSICPSDAVWAMRAGPVAHRQRRGRLAGRRRRRRRASPATWRSSRRSPAIDRLEVRGRDSAGRARATCGITGSTSPTRPWRPLDRTRGGDRLFQGRLACASRGDGCWRSSTRRRPRSASWATTPERCAPPSATTSCCAWRSRAAVHACQRPRPHPLGQRRHHLVSRTRTRSTASRSEASEPVAGRTRSPR